MIEIRTFEGDAAELSEFTVAMWRKSYEGKIPVPLWSPELLRRELMPTDDDERRLLVAAYDGTKLVGSHPAREVNVSLRGEEKPAGWGSYLCVDPEYHRRGIGRKMDEELNRRHNERGAIARFGYVFIRSAQAMGSKFWLKRPNNTVIVRSVGVWERALDHRRVSQFALYPSERIGTRVISLWQRAPRGSRDATAIREYREGDLDDCAELVRRQSMEVDLGFLWDRGDLARLLQYDNLSRTIVFEADGKVGGLVSYYCQPVLGQCVIDVGVIDLLILGSLSKSDRLHLLQAVLKQMADEGLHAAMLVRGSWDGGRTLAAAGFFPSPPEYYYVGTKLQDDVDLETIRRLHILWR